MLHKWFATAIFSATQRCNIVATLFGMVTTLPQHCKAVLRWKSSLRIVACNMTFKRASIKKVTLCSRQQCSRILWIGTLRSNDADGNENVKKTIRLISKTTTLQVHHTFWYISFPFLHDYDVKMPNFAFYEGRKQATTKFYFSFWAWIWSLEIQLQKGSPTIDKVSG